MRGSGKLSGRVTACVVALTLLVGAQGCAKGEDTGAKVDSMNAMGATTDSAKRTGAPAAQASADAEMQAVLDQLASLNGKPIETLTPAEARKQPTPTDAVKALLAKQGKPAAPPPGATLSNRSVGGAAGQLPANIYTPDGAGPFPVIVYYHGGGWVLGSKDVYDGGARALAIMARAVVISADYRMGPENKFPASHDDALATYEWALKNAASIKGDPKRVALAGESAGGNLAVATAMAARDKRLQMPLAVIAVYPISSGDTTSASYVENANAKPLSRAVMSWFFDNSLRTPADRQDPRINLLGANLAGLPPVTIINAQIDPLRSEGEMLAGKLRDAGVAVEQKSWDGVTHEFFGMGAVHPKAVEAQKWAADALGKVFNK